MKLSTLLIAGVATVAGAAGLHVLNQRAIRDDVNAQKMAGKYIDNLPKEEDPISWWVKLSLEKQLAFQALQRCALAGGYTTAEVNKLIETMNSK